jgi:hypothetical protein
MVTQVRSRVTPVSGNAFLSKYYQSHVAVGGSGVPAIDYLEQPRESRRTLIGWVKTCAKLAVRDQIGESSKCL